MCTGALGRDIKMEELQGSLAVDGFSSAISGCFGCPPLTSFSQNVGLVTMTGVINRFTIFTGALILILASLFPPLGAFFNSLPQAVLGGCTVMMFGSIMYEGIKMLKECEFDDRTMIIVSLAFCIGVGLTQTSGNFFAAFHVNTLAFENFFFRFGWARINFFFPEALCIHHDTQNCEKHKSNQDEV